MATRGGRGRGRKRSSGGGTWIPIGVLWDSASGSRAEMSGKINSLPTDPKWDGSISIFKAGDRANFDYNISVKIGGDDEEEDTKGSRRGRRSRRDRNDDEDQDEEEGDDFDQGPGDDDEGDEEGCPECGNTDLIEDQNEDLVCNACGTVIELKADEDPGESGRPNNLKFKSGFCNFCGETAKEGDPYCPIGKDLVKQKEKCRLGKWRVPEDVKKGDVPF